MQNNQTENENKIPTKNCPFCCSEIPRAAQKCPYCGEWVVRRKETMSPSDMARAVNRGLKEKEVDDWWFHGCLPKIILVVVVVVYGYTDSLKVALITGFVLLLMASFSYFKE